MLSGQDFRGEKPSRSQESWRFFEFPEAGHSADEIATNPAAGRCVSVQLSLGTAFAS